MTHLSVTHSYHQNVSFHSNCYRQTLTRNGVYAQQDKYVGQNNHLKCNCELFVCQQKAKTEVCQCFCCHARGRWIIIMRFKLHAGFALLNCCVAPFLGRSTNSVIMSTSNSNRWQMAIMQDYNAEHQIIWSSIDDPALSVGSSMENAIPCKKKYSCWAGLTFACNGLGWVGWGADTRMGTDVPRSLVVPPSLPGFYDLEAKATKMSHS